MTAPQLRTLDLTMRSLRLPAVLAVSLVAAGCAGEASESADSEEGKLGSSSESAAAASRASCKFHRGAMPSETVGKELPLGDAMPIENIVVIMQENRSFDSYFGHLNKYAHRTDIESAPEDTTNPEKVNTPGSPRHAWQHAERLCISDTNHEWAGSHLEYNDGKMDGFFQANHGFRESGQPFVDKAQLDGTRAMWWYDERDIPFYYDLASTFAIADHYHSSLLGPTYPNRDYLYAATSRGVTTGHKMDLNGLGPDKNILIFDELDNRGISWTIYVDSIPHIPRVGASIGAGFLSRWDGQHIKWMSQFSSDARNGTLPQVAFVDGQISETVNGNDEHPPGDIQLGQEFVSDRVHELFKSPQWSKLALFITYDEHGGIYDHVAPPAACPPDDMDPVLEEDDDKAFPGRFDRLGVRVPFMMVSPYAKKAFVSHKTYDHTSITRFIETRFKLPALSNRDANADPMFDLFDFDHPAFLEPPAIAEAKVDFRRLQSCRDIFAPPQANEHHGGH